MHAVCINSDFLRTLLDVSHSPVISGHDRTFSRIWPSPHTIWSKRLMVTLLSELVLSHSGTWKVVIRVLTLVRHS